MYLINKYTNTYYKIIDRAKTRDITGYTEKHHIIPKSLGGSNSKDNLVKLTAREHFICHLLLSKMTDGTNRQKMFLALKMLTRLKNKICITSKQFETIRINANNAHKMFRAGVKLSDATKEKLSIINTGKKYGRRSEATCLKISKATKGKSKSIEHREKAIKNLKRIPKGSTLSEEHKANMRKPKLVIECPHCYKQGGNSQMKRYHFDKCKLFSFQ